MAIQIDEVTSTTQLDGTSGKGLFAPTVTSSSQQVFVRGLYFHFAGTAPTITVDLQDPDNASNTVTILSSTASDYSVTTGFYIPTSSSGTAWTMKTSTSGKTDTGYMTVDYEIHSTAE